MGLQAKLDAFKAEIESGAPPYNVKASVVERMARAIAELVGSGAAERALKAGDRAPSFALADADGHTVASAALLASGPLVVSFYRGVWCPYCNMELQALQAALPQIEALGANLVAISPQQPANSRKSRLQNGLTFPILSDPHNATAEAFGLKYKLSDDLIDVYRGFHNDLALVNGDASWTLPMPARYVIGRDGLIIYAEVNPDYTRRPDPEDLLPALRQAAAAVAT